MIGMPVQDEVEVRRIGVQAVFHRDGIPGQVGTSTSDEVPHRGEIRAVHYFGIVRFDDPAGSVTTGLDARYPYLGHAVKGIGGVVIDHIGHGTRLMRDRPGLWKVGEQFPRHHQIDIDSQRVQPPVRPAAGRQHETGARPGPSVRRRDLDALFGREDRSDFRLRQGVHAVFPDAVPQASDHFIGEEHGTVGLADGFAVRWQA